MTTIEYFCNPYCSMCFLLSPQIRRSLQEHNARIIQRAFIKNRDFKTWTKKESAYSLSDEEIDYSKGYMVALYAKAIERIKGQEAHWDFYDAVQNAFLCESKNISDARLLNQIAWSLGVDHLELIATLYLSELRESIRSDMERADDFRIRSTPAVIIDGRYVIDSFSTSQHLKTLFHYVKNRNSNTANISGSSWQF